MPFIKQNVDGDGTSVFGNREEWPIDNNNMIPESRMWMRMVRTYANTYTSP